MELKFKFCKPKIYLVFTFLTLFVFGLTCDQPQVEIQEEIISEGEPENDPFADLPCVISCVVTPSPSSNSSIGKDYVLECRNCDQVNVIRVIDGDTVETNRGVIRFYGADTPEKGESCFKDASAKTESLITQKMGEPYIGSIRVEEGERLQDIYGRLLFYVYTLDGISIEGILIKEGLARAWTKDGQHLEYFKKLDSNYVKENSRCFQNK